MSPDERKGTTVAQQTTFVIPDLTIKELLDAIP